jgi:hypothetical protein
MRLIVIINDLVDFVNHHLDGTAKLRNRPQPQEIVRSKGTKEQKQQKNNNHPTATVAFLVCVSGRGHGV